jgi:tetratricopeptide (TPR) repeat protein
MKLDLAAELLATVGAKPEVQERHLVKVVELADAILAQEPENSLVLFNQGLALHRLKSGSGDETFQRVVAIASKAIARSPNDDKQYNVRGVAYAQLKKYDQAKADLRRAIELNPQEKQLQLDLRTVEYDEQVAAGGH